MAALPELDLHLMGLNVPTQLNETISLSGTELKTCKLPEGTQFSMACTWDEVFSRIGSLERMFPEPDGSFMWVGFEGNREWQLNGMVYDRAGVVQWCEIKGKCPLSDWETLLTCFGWPQHSLIAQFPREQAFVQIEELKHLWQRS